MITADEIEAEPTERRTIVEYQRKSEDPEMPNETARLWSPADPAMVGPDNIES
jgi:hypothetical protein